MNNRKAMAHEVCKNLLAGGCQKGAVSCADKVNRRSFNSGGYKGWGVEKHPRAVEFREHGNHVKSSGLEIALGREIERRDDVGGLRGQDSEWGCGANCNGKTGNRKGDASGPGEGWLEERLRLLEMDGPIN